MIVVDTNVIAYLWIPGDFTEVAEQALRKDKEWCAPLLWRSEMRNILAGYLRRKKLSLETALQIIESAEIHLKDREFTVSSSQVLSLTISSSCSAYDCEFVALAENLRVPLVTNDKQILADFPLITVTLKKFIEN